VRRLCERLSRRLLSEAELGRAMAAMDADHDGTVSLPEFTEWFARMAHTPSGMFAPLFVSGVKVGKASLSLPDDGGQVSFSPNAWIDASAPQPQKVAEATEEDTAAGVGAEAEDNGGEEGEQEETETGSALGVAAAVVPPLRAFEVSQRTPSKRSGRSRGASSSSSSHGRGQRGGGGGSWPQLGDLVELADNDGLPADVGLNDSGRSKAGRCGVRCVLLGGRLD
jgi:uncharacterized membrane protein YgcG